jgi:hypothetical protein
VRRAAPIDTAMRRRLLVPIVAVLALTGCGETGPPDAATSRKLITQTVIDWHRFQATGRGDAACKLATNEEQERTVKFQRNLAASTGRPAPDSCEEAMANEPTSLADFRDLMMNVRVDAVQIDGDHATATTHTSAIVNGASVDTPPAQLKLRWENGRWLMD